LLDPCLIGTERVDAQAQLQGLVVVAAAGAG